MTEEKENKEKKILVVQQLPTTPVRDVKDEEGNEFDCVTVEEALTEILTTVRDIKKQVS